MSDVFSSDYDVEYEDNIGSNGPVKNKYETGEIKLIQKEIQLVTKKIEQEKIKLRIIDERLDAKKKQYNILQGKPVPKTDEEKIKEAYLKKIKESYLNCSDYRIDSVKVLSTAEKQELINSIPEYKDAEILAIVNYSIKPQDITNYVIAGNGEVSGEWVVNKSACVSYKNGTILTDGTGW